MKKIKNISIAFVSISIGMVSMYSIMKKQLHLISEMSDKHLALFRMMAQWVKIKQEGKNISDYLLKEGYREVAVYGMSYAGERLVNELDNTDIHVKYGIDKILSPLASLTLHEETSECKSCHERLPINQGGSRASQALYNKHVYIMKKKNFS